MACVEDLDRGEPEGFRQECNQAFLLTVRGRGGAGEGQGEEERSVVCVGAQAATA